MPINSLTQGHRYVHYMLPSLPHLSMYVNIKLKVWKMISHSHSHINIHTHCEAQTFIYTYIHYMYSHSNAHISLTQSTHINKLKQAWYIFAYSSQDGFIKISMFRNSCTHINTQIVTSVLKDCHMNAHVQVTVIHKGTAYICMCIHMCIYIYTYT